MCLNLGNCLNLFLNIANLIHSFRGKLKTIKKSQIWKRVTVYNVKIGSSQFLRAKAAAIPPARSPTAVAVMPIPITPSTFQQMYSKLLQSNATM